MRGQRRVAKRRQWQRSRARVALRGPALVLLISLSLLFLVLPLPEAARLGIGRHDEATERDEGEQALRDGKTRGDAIGTNCQASRSRTPSNKNRRSKLVPRFFSRLGSDEAMIHRAYLLALLSSLSYWPFHEEPIPGGAGSVRLSRRASTARKSARVWFCGARKRGRRARGVLRLALSRVSREFKSTEGAKRRTVGRFVRMVRASLARFLPRMAWIRAPLTIADSSSERAQSKLKEEPSENPSFPCGGPKSIQKGSGKRYVFQWYLHDWFERGPSGVKWHDTDVLVATSGFGDEIVLAFAGSASTKDYVTNAQTFERASHSNLFLNGTLGGSVHRGFLNAYSRVEQGSIIRLKENNVDDNAPRGPLRGLHRRYYRCIAKKTKEPKGRRKKKARRQQQQNYLQGQDDGLANATGVTSDFYATLANDIVGYENSTDNARLYQKKQRGDAKLCSAKGEKLMTILREIVTDALRSGRLVHLAGHSLGGGLANLLALDIIINFPAVPISGLRIWTYGAPEVADEVFYESAAAASPRLQSFLGSGAFHRFVTLSEDCEEDFITTMAARILSPHDRVRGWVTQLLGGTKGSVAHAADPLYIFPVDKVKKESGNTTDISSPAAGAQKKKKKKEPMRKQKLITSVDVHKTTHYLRGLSRLSVDYPLGSDLPTSVADWIGE